MATATLTESDQLQRYPSGGKVTLKGYRFTDRALKVDGSDEHIR